MEDSRYTQKGGQGRPYRAHHKFLTSFLDASTRGMRCNSWLEAINVKLMS